MPVFANYLPNPKSFLEKVNDVAKGFIGPVYGDESEEKSDDDVSKKADEFIRNDPVPTMGHGTKNIYVFVSPYCPHCQNIVGYVSQIVSQKKQYRFHIFWISDKSDQFGRLACQKLMQAHPAGLAEKMCQAIGEKARFLEAQDFDLFERENHVSFKDDDFQNILLDKINHFASSLDIEGFPALFYGKKSILGCPENISELLQEIEDLVS